MLEETDGVGDFHQYLHRRTHTDEARRLACVARLESTKYRISSSFLSDPIRPWLIFRISLLLVFWRYLESQRNNVLKGILSMLTSIIAPSLVSLCSSHEGSKGMALTCYKQVVERPSSMDHSSVWECRHKIRALYHLSRETRHLSLRGRSATIVL